MENSEIYAKTQKLKRWAEVNKPSPGNEDEFREMVIDILEDLAYKRLPVSS